MARPTKEGIDYFPFDVDLIKDRKLRRPKMKYGSNAAMVYLILLTLLYKDKGYYIDYSGNKKEDVLWEVQESLQGKFQPDIETVESMIADLVACELFSGDQFENESVITSVRAQETYYRATVDRKTANINYDYWLLSKEQMEGLSSKHPILVNFINRLNNEVNHPNNLINRTDKPQSKVKESKVNKSKESISRLWELYPFKQGRGDAIKKIPTLITEYGFEQMERAIDRYQKYVEKRRAIDFPELKYQNGDTFFNSGYVDYLDENFDESIMNIKKIVSGKNKQTIESDPSREQAYEALEIKYAENPWEENLGGEINE